MDTKDFERRIFATDELERKRLERLAEEVAAADQEGEGSVSKVAECLEANQNFPRGRRWSFGGQRNFDSVLDDNDALATTLSQYLATNILVSIRKKPNWISFNSFPFLIFCLLNVKGHHIVCENKIINVTRRNNSSRPNFRSVGF